MSAARTTQEELAAWLVGQVADRAGISVTDVALDEPFALYGLDSAALAALTADLGSRLGRPVAVTAVFEYPTISQLASALAGGPATAEARGPRPRLADDAAGEPVAIVGLACRFPGAPGKDEYLRLLRDGRSAVREVPEDRWSASAFWDPDSAVPGRTTSKWGGFVDGIDRFDAAFFGISAYEAARMDPQQRMLLEASWEALEDAGANPDSLSGSATGVFVGISASEYGTRGLANPETIDGLIPTGSALSTAANRISYTLDLHGPSLAVDTACSSSLVATHLAARAVRSGECDVALAAGVNALLDPELTIALSKAGMLAPDGRCKPFDAAANGYVRGEGCGVVVLKRLSDAVAHGDRVYAVVLGSAVNQDGRSNGLTAPNPAAQAAVLRAAYLDAHVDPAAVGYVECHGTGTALGDPLEVEALARVVGDRAGRSPCVIGSVKASIGHLESAAGIASLIKVALSLHHGEIFPSINVQTPNPAIPFARLPVTVAGPGASWPGVGAPRLAGVSGFGFGGTNAHMVLAARDPGEPARPERPYAEVGPLVLPLAARTRSALAETARRWAGRLREADPGELAALLRTAVTGRSHRGFRLAVTGATGAELADRLATAADDRGVGEQPARQAPRVAFVFSGQGGQWAGMGRALMRSDPLFASALRRCDEAAAPFGVSITGLLGNASDEDLARTEIAQPVLFALQTALVTSLRAYGVEATALLGHSVGEIAAAWACGRLSLEAAMRVAVVRGQAMASTAGSGRMLAARLAPAEAAGYCSRAPGVVIAAVNSVSDVVFAGPEEDLAAIADACQSVGRSAWWVPGRYPFHSPAMEEAAARLAADLGGLQPRAGQMPWYSSVRGGRADQVSPDAAYWAENVRRPVLLADALDALMADGVEAIVEVGPHGGLVSSIRRHLHSLGHDQVRVLATLTRHQDDQQGVRSALAELFEIGCGLRWRRLLTGAPAVVEAPLYPWQRDRHWLERPERPGRPVSGAAGMPGSRSGPLGGPVDLADAAAPKVWTSVVEPDAFFRDHRIAGTAVFPAAGYVELAVAAARQTGAEGAVRLRDVRFTAPLLLDVPQLVQTVLDTESHAFAVYARRSDGPGEWRLHAQGIAVAADGDLTPPDTVPSCPGELSPDELYAGFARRGFDYGPDFRVLSQIRNGDGTAVARVRTGDPAAAGGRVCDPRLMDGCFQLVAAALTDAVTERLGGLLAPSGLADLTVAPAISAAAFGQARVREVHVAAEGLTDVDIDLVGADGQPLASIRGLRLAALAVPRPARFLGEDPWLYEPAWEPRAAGPADRAESGSWLLLGDPDGTGRRLARELADAGEQAVLRLDPDQADLASLLTELAGASRPLRGVVFLGGVRDADESGLPAEAQASLATAVRLVQNLSFLPVQEIPGLWFVTRGAQPVSPADPTDPCDAVLWGLAKAVPFENPALACRCVDLSPPGDDEPDVAGLAAELLHPSMETEIGFRSGVRHVRRLVPATPAAGLLRATVGAEGGYLITGGTGALGLAVAELLVARGARRIALVGRRGADAAAAPALDRLRAAGTEVVVLTADVRDADAVADAVGAARRRFGRLRGVVHAAGVLADGPLLGMSEVDLAAVAGPKVAGAWNLHQALAGDRLDWLVLFSSAAALLGSPGQANYCAANAFLDGLAHYRRGRGLPAISINWGPWARDGMAARGSSDRALRTAVNMLEPEAALDALELLLSGDRRQALVMSFDLVNLVQYYPSGLGLPFFEALTSAAGDHLRSAGAAPQAIARAGHLGAYVQPGNEVESRIAAILQSALGIGPVGAADGFFALGGDSVLGNQILIEVNRAFDVRIDAEQAFADFTVGRLAELVNAALITRVAAMTDEEAAQYLRELG